MNLTILGFLWRRHRVTVSLCCAAPLFIGVIIGFVFPIYQEQRELIEKLLRAFSFATRFFGNEQLSMLRPEGAFAMPFQHPMALIAYAILGAIPALGLPAGERGRGALDLLLSTPLSRGQLIGSVAAFLLIIAPFVGLGALLGAYLGGVIASVADQLPLFEYGIAALNASALAFCLGGVALVVSTISPDRGRATVGYGVTVFVLLGLDITARFVGDQAAWLRWMTPYGMLRPVEVVNEVGTARLYIAVLMGLGLALCAVAWQIAERRSRA